MIGSSSRPIRVAHVIGGADTGGAMTHLLPLLSALVKRGVELELVCLGPGGLAEAARERELPVRVLPMTHRWDVTVLRPLWSTLSAESWDVVHSHGMRANLPARLLAPWLRPRPCLVTTVHSDLSLDYGPVLASFYGLLDRLSGLALDRLICVSEDLRARLSARGWDQERLVVVPSGLELAVEAGPPGGASNVLAELASSAVPTVGTVARLVPVKDLDLLLEVADRLHRRLPEARFLLVGEGPEGPRLQRQAELLGLGSVVKLTGEVRPASPALALMDAYLLTSLSEGLPLSVLEAMAAGLPVVATRVGGLPEVVEEGVTGFLIPRTDSREKMAHDLAECLERLLREPELRKRMGAAGAERVRRHFSASSAARRTIRVYERCLVERAA